MGGRKFRLARHRKNEERKKKISQESGINLSATSQLLIEPPTSTLIVSLPLDAFTNGTVTTRQDLSSRFMKSTLLPSPWLMASTNPLVFCKLRVPRDVDHGCGAWLNISLTLHEDLKWSLFVKSKKLDLTLCPFLATFPIRLASVSAVCQFLSGVDSANLCSGNQETRFLELWQHRTLTLHGSSGEEIEIVLCMHMHIHVHTYLHAHAHICTCTNMHAHIHPFFRPIPLDPMRVHVYMHISICIYIVVCFDVTGTSIAYVDKDSIPGQTSVHHKDCQLLLDASCRLVRCSACASLRITLSAQSRRLEKQDEVASTHTSHINHRYPTYAFF